MRDLGLEGRHVVVTGASGALGAAVVDRLLEAGAVAHLPQRSPDAGGTPRRSGGDRVHAVTGVDVADPESVRGLYASLPSLWASIHCAGGFAAAPIGETSHDVLRGQLRTNLEATYLCCREAAEAIRRCGRKGGRIVNVAARAGIEPRTGAGMTAYAASKAGVAGLTVALGEELAPEGIWVNAIAPSILDTEANRRAMPDADHERWPSCPDVAATIVFLASPSNRTTRGAVVPVYARA